jgi:hypothetical protein
MPESESNRGIMRQQVSDLLEDAVRTSDTSRKRELASRAFALAQNAEVAKRKASERQGAPSR